MLAGSVAEQTEIVWTESWSGSASTQRRQEAGPLAHHRAIEIRVVDGGRQGFYVTGVDEPGEIAGALRLALAHARVADVATHPRELPEGDILETQPGLFDPAMAELSPAAAQSWLAGVVGESELGRLRWQLCREVIVNSRGLVRAAETTAAALRIESGRGPGMGIAERAARSLAALQAGEVVERARRGRCEETATGSLPATPPHLLLAPEAVAALLAHLATRGLSAAGFGAGRLWSREHLGQAVTAESVHLVDDATHPASLAFPFDREGRGRHPIALIAGGVLRTPAVDAALAAELGLPATPHFIAPDEARPLHLRLEPGQAEWAELVACAGEGLLLPNLEGLVWLADGGGRFRAIVQGARSISDGTLGPAIPRLVWEDDLLRVLREVLVLGRETVTVAIDEHLSGSVEAPAVLVEAGGALGA